MTIKSSLTSQIISQAESYNGIRAGIALVINVLHGPSYKVDQHGPTRADAFDDDQVDDWSDEAQTILVLGLHHPEGDLYLDYFERGDTWGNRRLREISEHLKQWLRKNLGLAAYPLPYHVEKGGIFLKDAAVLSGIGVIGRNNLLLHPEWGPRIRLRSILLEGELEPTAPISGFDPCKTCAVFCQKACPAEAFPAGKFSRPNCRKQIDDDFENKVPEGKTKEDGRRSLVVKFCRACEFSCPVGV
jgi:epoxyqueuosine reductase